MVALLLAIVAQATNPHLTLNSRGASVGSILREASRLTGISMAAVQPIRDEIVIVAVKDVKVTDFQARLAEAVGARWRATGGVARLVLPLELERSQAEAERKLRIVEVKSGLEKLRRRVVSQAAFDAKEAHDLAEKLDGINTKYKGYLSDSPGLEETVALEPRTPGGRLSIAAVATLTPEQVADVAPGERIVYSTDPTPVQRVVPADLTSAIRRYQLEERLFEDALKQLPVGQGNGRYAVRESTSSGSDEVAGILMVTARSPYNPSLTVDIHLVRKDGTYAGGARSLLDLDEGSLTQPALGEGKAPLSPNSIQFTNAVNQLQKGKTFLEDQDMLMKLSNPEKFDPLSYVAADGVLALGGQENLIACVPDSGFYEPAFTALSGKTDLDKAKFSNWLTTNCTVTRSNGWFVASPLRNITTRETRSDRAVLGQFLRRSLDHGGLRLEELADFASRMPRDYMNTLAPFLAFFVLPDLNASISDRTIEILRVYGRMTPEQKVALAAGKPIAVANMAEASQADLNHMVYRADPPLSYITRSGPGVPPPISTSIESTQFEVTCCMPNGIPGNATYTMNAVSEPAVIPDGGTPGGSYRPLNAHSLAYQLVRAEKADPTDKRESAKIDKYRFGQSRNISVEVVLTPSLSVNGTLRETNFPRKDASVPYRELPASFRSAVENAMVQVRQQQVAPGGAANRKVPPPW